MVALSLMLGTVGAVAVAGPAQASAVNYYLPYTAGFTAVMTQGPGGPSHTNIYNADAYDFDLNGGAVRASAPGTIVAKVTSFTGPTGSSGGAGNEVVVKHADNTCTRYAHMAHGSVTTKAVNDTVGQGEQLGNEGDTGYTFGAHLHFQRENCSNITTPVGFVENNWTSQNNGVTAPSVSSLTGDNKADIFWYEAWNNGTGKVVPTNSSGTGSTSGSAWLTGWTTPPTWAGLGDFNADGKTDLAWFDATIGGGTMKVLLSNGSGFSSQVTWFTGWSTPTKILVGDFNNDDRSDLAWYDASTGGGTMTVIETVVSGSSVGSGPSTTWFTGWSNPQWADVGDFNGDGLADLAWMNSGTLSVVTTTKSGSTIGSGPSYTWFTGWSTPTKAVVGDFNSDGLADLGWYQNWANGGTLFVIPTTKSGSTIGSGPAVTWFTGWSTPTRMFAGDFTGDGNADIGWYSSSTMYVIATNKSGSTIGSGSAYTWFTGWSNADWAGVG